MKTYIENRVREVANYILATRSTIRKTAKVFGISKSTAWKDACERCKTIDPQLHSQVLDVINYNISQRNIRGGEATRRKYADRN